MKTEFRTIEIGKFIASIFVMFFMCLLLQRAIGFDADAIYYTLPLIALLYLIFRGKICFAIYDSELSICWVKRPFLCSFENKIIEYSSIIHWKYETSSRGPDAIIIILKSGEVVNLKPSIFNTRDLKREIFRNLILKVSGYHSNTSSEVLKDKILKSVYFKKLETQIVSNKNLLRVIGCIEIAILVVSVLSKKFREVNQVWFIFSVLLFVFVVASLRTHYLKNEKQDLLNWD